MSTASYGCLLQQRLVKQLRLDSGPAELHNSSEADAGAGNLLDILRTTFVASCSIWYLDSGYRG